MGKPIGLCGIATDITDRKKAEDEIREAVQMLSGPIREGNLDFEYHGIYSDYMGNQVLGAMETLMMGSAPIGLVVEIDYNEAFP